jgi:osmoprotectant transport system ATP-binding protein
MSSNEGPAREGASVERSAAALSAIGVSKQFGSTRALEGISLDVAEGECLALVGESGSGKSTLLRCFNRLVEPDAGRIIVAGVEAATSDPVQLRRSIGYVPQDGGLLPHWRVGRNVELVLRLVPGHEDGQARVDEVLRLVGLEPTVFRDRWPRELSGGQRQRVALARALAARPRLLLLDEPFGALDAISRADIQDAFFQLRQSAGQRSLSCVLVTHDLHEAFLLADRIAVMRRGRLEQVATPEELLGAPATAYVTELLERARVDELPQRAVRQEGLS